MIEWLSSPEAWVGLLTLTILEIVLGVDNVIFIAILAGRLPPEQRARARKVGLALALVTRVLLLISIAWMAGLTQPLFSILDKGFSGRDLILLGGGLFLLAKSVTEIHHKLEGVESGQAVSQATLTFGSAIAQILVLDVVFSLDSVITAVGMANQVGVMIAAVVIALGFMLVFAGAISNFVDKHPTIKMLALAFLVLIGGNLVAEGMGVHVPKGYTYFAMAFSVGVELLNMKLRKKSDPVSLHK